MKHIYILILSLVLVACGNSEKNNESAVEESSNTNQIIITNNHPLTRLNPLLPPWHMFDFLLC